MFIITSANDQAHFADILRHVEKEQQVLEFMDGDLPPKRHYHSHERTVPTRRAIERAWNLLLSLLAIFNSTVMH